MADEGGGTGRRKRLADADARLRRFQDEIGAGIDPNALIDAINQAQAQRAAARAELDNTPAPEAITDAEIHAMIDLARQTDRTSRMDQRTRERLHPTVDRDVVDLGAAFGQQLLDLSVRQSVAQIASVPPP